jgi:hypothetical protein
LHARLDRAAGDGNRHFAQGDLVLAALIDERRDGRGAAETYPTRPPGVIAESSQKSTLRNWRWGFESSRTRQRLWI